MGIDFTRRVDEIQGIFKVRSDIFVPFSFFLMQELLPWQNNTHFKIFCNHHGTLKGKITPQKHMIQLQSLNATEADYINNVCNCSAHGNAQTIRNFMM